MCSSVGQLFRKCSTELCSWHVPQSFRKLRPSPISWETLVCPVRRRESTICSLLSLRSSQCSVQHLIFLVKRDRSRCHCLLQASSVFFFSHNLMSAHGTLLVRGVLSIPELAHRSTFSFPAIPQWPGIHIRVVFGCVSNAFWIAWIQGWRLFSDWVARMTLAESVAIKTGPIMSCWCVMAWKMAAASAVKTEHCSGRHRLHTNRFQLFQETWNRRYIEC